MSACSFQFHFDIYFFYLHFTLPSSFESTNWVYYQHDQKRPLRKNWTGHQSNLLLYTPLYFPTKETNQFSNCPVQSGQIENTGQISPDPPSLCCSTSVASQMAHYSLYTINSTFDQGPLVVHNTWNRVPFGMLTLSGLWSRPGRWTAHYWFTFTMPFLTDCIPNGTLFSMNCTAFGNRESFGTQTLLSDSVTSLISLIPLPGTKPL